MAGTDALEGGGESCGVLLVVGEESVEFDAEVGGLDVLEEPRSQRGNFLH